MKRIKSNLAVKMAAVFLAVASAAVSAAGMLGILVMESYGIYDIQKETMLKRAYGEVRDNYSILALSGYEDDFNLKKLSGTNFKFGVIKADDLDDVDLTDRKNYKLASNFDEPLKDKDLEVYECEIGENTWFVSGKYIWNYFYVGDEDEYVEKEYEIDGIYYDTDSENLYIKSGRKLFMQEDYYVDTEDGGQVSWLDNDMVMGEENDEKSEPMWDPYYQYITFNEEYTYDMNHVEIVDRDALSELGVVSSRTVSYVTDDKVYVKTRKKKDADHYYVVSYVQQPLQGDRSIWTGDMYMQAELIINWMYQMRYWMIVILILSLAVFLAAFVFLMSAAGHHPGREGITPFLLDSMPLDLYFAGICAAEAVLADIALTAPQSFTGMVTERPFDWIISAGAVTLGLLAALAFCMSFAVNVKMGKWYQRTVIYRIWKMCISFLGKIIRFCVYMIKSLLQSITLLWKAWLIMGTLALMEFIVLVFSDWYYYEREYLIFWWLVEKVILSTVIIFVLIQMNRLQKGAQCIANGKMDYHIDTSRMFWELKKHGGYLNDIGTGINLAVNERMKSEHFKTELITNVSHDIKTPLTSIINYVDLLQKEQIDNPAAQEYLEVLSRQSASLKNLIEDLMEASKASTGNINIIMEQCDAGVMLVQTVGEFEEKLMAGQIELQIKRPQESVLIEADSRHLWRVFDNMMNNMCKYAQPMTRAYVNLEKREQEAVIIFRNISKYQLNISGEELMERFVRGDSSRNTEGSGLGISIAKSLTELMNGTFELTVDGDLFKVVLVFPLYGMKQAERTKQAEQSHAESREWASQEKIESLKEGVAAGIQNAGAYAKNLGNGAAYKTGRAFRRARRFVKNVRQAAEQTKAEEAEERKKSEND